MADREERLLNELLRDIAREDAALAAPDLEMRVMEACAPMVRLKPDTTISGSFLTAPKNRTRPVFGVAVFAAAAVVALGVAATLHRRDPQPVAPATVAAPPQKSVEMVVNEAPKASPRPLKRAPKAAVPAPAPPVAVSAEAVDEPVHMPQPAASEAAAEFVPLLPLTAQELTGPFQLVRVQMPRASLGPLRSPLDHPAELVEADVLLGEDGRARAIRISAAGSIYPWRFK